MIRPSDRGERQTNRAADGPANGADRGQLLLVGAVAIALVFLGLVVVFNTVLFTDSTSPTEPLEAAEEARSFREQVRNDTRMIMFEIANESETLGATPGGCSFSLASGTIDNNWECYAARNITEYGLVMATSYADTGPVYASVKVEDISMDLTGLQATVEVTYRTSEFEYIDTMVVTTSAP